MSEVEIVFGRQAVLACLVFVVDIYAKQTFKTSYKVNQIVQQI